MSKFVCDKCKKEFSRKDNLKRHQKTSCNGGKQVATPDQCIEIADLILKQLPKRQRLKVKVPRKGDLKPEIWLLQFSDLHYGLLVKPVEVGGLSEYNPTIAKERLEYLAETMIRLLEYYPARPRELVIASLGDVVEGAIMRGNQQSNIEFGIINQAILVSELLTDFIVSLSKYFPRIRFYGVSGNHGRLTKGITDSHPSENLDRMVYYIVKERVKQMQGITVDYTESQHMIVQIGDKKFWLEHGDTVKSWTGIPFYGGKREKANIADILAQFGLYADYMLVGHHHDPAIFSGLFYNGSFVGGDLFSIGRIRRMAVPNQNLLGINPQRGMVWYRPIVLVKDFKPESVKIYK